MRDREREEREKERERGQEREKTEKEIDNEKIWREREWWSKRYRKRNRQIRRVIETEIYEERE